MAWKGYRSYRIYRPATGKMGTVDSVSWFPRKPMPTITPQEAVRYAMDHLRDTLLEIKDTVWEPITQAITATMDKMPQAEAKGQDFSLREHGGRFGADMRALDPKGKHGYGVRMCSECQYDRCQCEDPARGEAEKLEDPPERIEAAPRQTNAEASMLNNGPLSESTATEQTRRSKTGVSNVGESAGGVGPEQMPQKSAAPEPTPTKTVRAQSNPYEVLEMDEVADCEGGVDKESQKTTEFTTSKSETRSHLTRDRKKPSKYTQINRVASAPGRKTIMITSAKMSKAERYEPMSREIEQGAIYEERISPEPSNTCDEHDETMAKRILDREFGNDEQVAKWWEETHPAYATLDSGELRVARIMQDGVRLNYPRAMQLKEAQEWQQANYEEWIRNVETRKSWKPIHPSEKRAPAKPSYVVPILEQKAGKKKRIRLAYDGNRSQYEGPRSSRTVSMQAKKIMMNHIVSTGKQIMTADVSDFYLAAPNVLPSEEYMWCPAKCLTQQINDHFKLKDLIVGGRVLLEITRPVYGLNQAGLIAMKKLKEILAQHGYDECDNECIFRSRDPNDKTLFCIHVDDLMFAFSRTPEAERIITILEQAGYKLKVDRDPQDYCGFHMEADENDKSITISMPNMVQNMLERFNLTAIQKRATPYPSHRPKYTGRQVTAPKDGSRPLNKQEIQLLQEKIGALLYLAMAVRVDIVTHVSKVSSQQATPTEQVMKDTDYIFGYLRAHPNRGIKYKASDMQLRAYTDASFDSENKARSRSGAVFFYGKRDDPSFVNGPIDHISRIQTTTHAMSSAEAEYVALYLCTMRTIHLRNLTEIVGHKQGATPISCDNICAVGLANDQVADGRTKHVERKYHFTRAIIAKGMVSVYWQAGTSNLADFFTKRLDEDTHWRFTKLFTVDLTNQ